MKKIIVAFAVLILGLQLMGCQSEMERLHENAERAREGASAAAQRYEDLDNLIDNYYRDKAALDQYK